MKTIFYEPPTGEEFSITASKIFDLLRKHPNTRVVCDHYFLLVIPPGTDYCEIILQYRRAEKRMQEKWVRSKQKERLDKVSHELEEGWKDYWTKLSRQNRLNRLGIKLPKK